MRDQSPDIGNTNSSDKIKFIIWLHDITSEYYTVNSQANGQFSTEKNNAG